MGITRTKPSTAEKRRRLLPGTTTVGAAVFFALYGLPHPAAADTADASTDSLQEITVTATRRVQTLEAVPYSLSVISADQLTQSGVTDLASLATTVPGLSMYDFGARMSEATSPIIRGINATAEPTRGFRTFEQAPVGTYIGNSPIDGYFQLDDLKQVEVLRGPQGTLYGAGALGGALRLIPNAPGSPYLRRLLRSGRRAPRPLRRHQLHLERHGQYPARRHSGVSSLREIRL